MLPFPSFAFSNLSLIANKMNSDMNKKKIMLSISFLFLMSILFGQQAVFDRTKSTVLSDQNKVVQFPDTVFAGKSCLKLDSREQAIIWQKDLELRNFRLEIDIAGAVMSGLGFRVKDEQNYHFLYFRPGYGGTREAIQYVPVYNGTLNWVFFNYPVYETATDIQALTWFHAAIEVMGDRLRVFVDHKEEPDMDIELPETGNERGSLLLRSMFGVSYFANAVLYELPEALRQWEISEQFPRDRKYAYADMKSVRSWNEISPGPGEVVNLSPHFTHPNGVVLARHNIESEENAKRLLHFDFAGKLQMYLNGKRLFEYEKYQVNRNGEHGLTIELPLQKGNNELVLISEGDGFIFGEGFNAMGRPQHQNWGFSAFLAN